MTPMSFAQVIKFVDDQRRFILQRLGQDLLLFTYSCTVVENNDDVEYWKCIHRVCSVRILTHGSSFQLLSEFARHHHNSHSSPDTASILKRNRYLVEKNLFQNKRGLRGSISSSIHATSGHQIEVDVDDCTDSDGTVLKQLLLTGKEENVSRGNSSIVRNRYSPLIPLVSRASSPSQLSTKELPVSLVKPKQAPEIERSFLPFKRNDGSIRQLAASQVCVAKHERTHWSPPVLTPPPAGRPYSPPLTPVAYIEPYVEPQVKYNPYFLWQLYMYKQSCSNYTLPFSIERTC